MKKKRLSVCPTYVGWTKLLRVMKLTVFLILILVVDVSASLYSQNSKVSVKVENGTLSEIFLKIEEQSEYLFFYQNEQIRDVERQSVEVSNKNALEVVANILKGTGLSYKLVDRNIIVFPTTEDARYLGNEAQQLITVSGKVSDSTGLPLPGVTVVLKGSSQGTITGTDGTYSITSIPGDATLVFSFVGMKSQEVKVSGQTKINITLEEEAIGIEEVVAIGYGSMKRKDLTGSVASVAGEVLSEISGATTAQALQGRTAGVMVQQNSGAPGADLQIRIRGNNSILGGNEPLWVIDGFPVSNANLINLSDIETIDILKDASATAIYGSRGANGVIIVTTKRGKAGKTNVTYDGSYGVQTLRKKFDMCNAKEYMQLVNIQQINDFGSEYFSQDEINNGENIDWQDLVYRSAITQDHSVNISGGDKKTRLALGLSYFDQEGIIRNTDFNRITIRGNIEHNISEVFDVSFNVILSRTKNNEKDDTGGQRGGNLQQSSFAAPPTVDPYNEDGSYRRMADAYTFMSSGFVNPVAYVNEVNKGWYRNKVMSNITLSAKPIKGLVIKTSGNVHNTEYRWDRYTSSKYPNSSGSAGIETVQVLELTTNNIVTYDKSIKDHSFSVMGGVTYDYSRNTPFRTSGEGFVHDIVETYDIGSAAIPGIPYSYFSERRIFSLLSRINYSYKDKYLLTATFRRDGSSAFSKDNKWGNFPSAGFAWRASEENFMKDIDFISNLKVRIGYGATGNQAVPTYGTINLLSSIQGVWDKNTYSGYDPRDRYPGDLHWETTKQTNFGFDIGLLNNRVSLIADYYIKNTTELLNNVQLPLSSGYTETTKNIGEMQNKGLEFQVFALVFDKSFKWNISSNISFNRNKVVELAGRQDIPGSWFALAWMGDYVNLIRENEPFGVFYGFKEAGYDDTGKILFKTKEGENVPAKDLSPDDKTIIGNPNPDFTYSFDSRMTYKNFSLNIFIQGVQGNDIYSLSMGSTNYDYGWGLNTFKEVLYNHWTPQKTDAKYPSITTTNTYQVSDRFVYDGSYLRLKNVELAYNLPLSKLGVKWMNKAQIYASGQNLVTITSYPWWDPDVNSKGGSTSVNQGIDHFSYPTAKSFTFGVRLQF